MTAAVTNPRDTTWLPASQASEGEAAPATVQRHQDEGQGDVRPDHGQRHPEGPVAGVELPGGEGARLSEDRPEVAVDEGQGGQRRERSRRPWIETTRRQPP